MIPIAERKIKINELRNPKEAFVLVANEDMQASIKRMKHNWIELKKRRNNKPPNLLKFFINKSDWWKHWLWVDENGWIREKDTNN